jgi:hypothetical protein
VRRTRNSKFAAALCTGANETVVFTQATSAGLKCLAMLLSFFIGLVSQLIQVRVLELYMAKSGKMSSAETATELCIFAY